MFKAAVIDDEANARKNLITIINNYCDDINIVGQAENVKSGQKLILNKKPDIVFLDIEMLHNACLELCIHNHLVS